jgi:hypothetical protein
MFTFKKEPVDQKPDQKLVTTVLQQLKPTISKATGGGKHNVTSIVLVLNQSSSSGAGAAQAPVLPVQPGNSPEFSSLAVLFDEFIVDKVEFIWNLTVQNSNTFDVEAAVAYDPINSGAYTAMTTVLEASQHHGPMQMGNCSLAVCPLSQNGTGFFRKMFTLPKGPSVQDPLATSRMGVGQWTSTGVTTTQYGQIKGYVTAPTGGLITKLNSYMRMYCRFRQRS